ncbi:MAG: hypothetical protein FWH12_04470 [Treponema sp.]|nr:hypothetical protein [Treponema sp.]
MQKAAALLFLALNLILAFFFGEESITFAGSVFLQFRFDAFRCLYGILASFLWLVASLFPPGSLKEKASQAIYTWACIITMLGALGVFYSGNLLTTFLFFELMSLSSYILVIHDQSPGALRAGETYLAVAVLGGLSLLMGIMLLLKRTSGALDYDTIHYAAMYMDNPGELYLPGAFLLAGFAAKAGLFPLHVWLPRAYSSAPAPANVLLSGVLSKTGVFGIILVSRNIFPSDIPWGLLLLSLASLSMILGAILALLSVNLMRTLACSSISQIGFICAAAALMSLQDSALPAQGMMLYMVNHSLFKLILFLLAGVVLMNTSSLELNQIRGFGRSKPLFLFVFLMAALGISGVPLWNGYISKTLLHKAILEGMIQYQGEALGTLLRVFDWVFLAASGLTIAYMAKLFRALFMDRPDPLSQGTIRKPYMSPLLALGLVLSALTLMALGLFPSLSRELLPGAEGLFRISSAPEALDFFYRDTLSGVIIPFLIGGLIYLLAVPHLLMGKRSEGRPYRDLWPRALDLEYLFYRPLLQGLYQGALVVLRRASSFPDWLTRLCLSTILRTSTKPYAPGKFLARHYELFFPGAPEIKKAPQPMGSFSINLLLIGAGISLVLVYVCILALRVIFRS